MQGIELTNPLLQAQQEDAQRSGTESYFSEYSGFRSIKGKWVFTSDFASISYRDVQITHFFGPLSSIAQ
jgi:hypothetical protein